MRKRHLAPMVADDDPLWARFWAFYPMRVAKKDARRAWAQLQPDAELVDRMVAALEWQAPLWERQGYGMPYPASWLRAERWTDEPPQGRSSEAPRGCKGHHNPPCATWTECTRRTLEDARRARAS